MTTPLQATPESIVSIGVQLRTQDNRATADPIFLVERQTRTYGLAPEWTDDTVWIDTENDCDEADAFQAEKLEYRSLRGKDIGGWVKTGYVDRWEYVQPFFTEVGAQAFIDANAHRYGGAEKLRIYADSAHRNREWQTLRRWLAAGGRDPGVPSTMKSVGMDVQAVLSSRAYDHPPEVWERDDEPHETLDISAEGRRILELAREGLDAPEDQQAIEALLEHFDGLTLGWPGESTAVPSEEREEPCEACFNLEAHFELAETMSEVAHPFLADHPGGFCLVCHNRAAHPWHQEPPALNGIREIERYVETMGWRLVRPSVEEAAVFESFSRGLLTSVEAGLGMSEPAQNGPPWPTIHPYAEGGYVWTWCTDCGPDVTVDEDGCCRSCGRAALYYGSPPQGEPTGVET